MGIVLSVGIVLSGLLTWQLTMFVFEVARDDQNQKLFRENEWKRLYINIFPTSLMSRWRRGKEVKAK